MRSAIAIVFVLFFSTLTFGQTVDGRVKPDDFKSDNCTCFPDGNYADCCVTHDKDYYFGGSLKERMASDKRLRKCVRSKGKGWKHKFLADVMFIGVRVGGVSFLPTPFRWGFGNKWPRKRPEKLKAKPQDIPLIQVVQTRKAGP